MNLFQRILKFGLKGIVVNPTLTSKFYQTNTTKGLQSENVTDPYSQNPWVFAAVTSIAQAAASVPFQIMKASGATVQPGSRRAQFRVALENARKNYSQDDEAEPVTAGAFYELFRSPNPDKSSSQVWEDTASWFKLRGEAAWVLESKTDARLRENEIPSEIWPVDPRMLKETIDKETGRIIAWTLSGKNPATGANIEVPYETWEIILFKTYNPKSPFRGMDQLTAAQMAMDQDLQASTYNQAFYENRAEPGGILSTETQLQPEQAREVRRMWEDRHAGKGKQFRVAILHDGMKYQEVKPFSHTDMAFMDQKKWNREEVLAVLKVPKMVVGLYEDINYATSQTAYKLFWQNAVIPMLRNFEDTLMTRLFVPLTSEDEWGVFDLSCVEALREDLEQKAKIADQFVRMGYPLNIVNERLELGFPKTENGDTEYAPQGLTPAGEIDPEMFDTSSPAEKPVVEEDPAAEEDVVAASADEIAFKRSAQAANRIEKVYNPGETIVLGKIKRYIYELRVATLKRLEAATAKAVRSPSLNPEDIDNILFVETEWNRKLQASMEPAFKKVMELSWNHTAKEVGSSLIFNLQDPRMLSLMGQNLALLVKVNANMKKKIRSSLISSLSKGETVDETAKALKAMFNQMSSGQALTIARTETGFAAVGAQADLYQQEGIEMVTWGTAGDELVRDTHVEAGRSEPIKFMVQKFPNGLHYPLELGAPPGEVINCRCSLDAYFPE